MPRRDPSFDATQLERLCRVLGDTDRGLTGSDIARLLARRGIADAAPDDTKWKRLFTALAQRQAQDGCGNCVLSFTADALQPVRFTGEPARYEWLRERINAVLAFRGL